MNCEGWINSVEISIDIEHLEMYTNRELRNNQHSSIPQLKRMSCAAQHMTFIEWVVNDSIALHDTIVFIGWTFFPCISVGGDCLYAPDVATISHAIPNKRIGDSLFSYSDTLLKYIYILHIRRLPISDKVVIQFEIIALFLQQNAHNIYDCELNEITITVKSKRYTGKKMMYKKWNDTYFNGSMFNVMGCSRIDMNICLHDFWSFTSGILLLFFLNFPSIRLKRTAVYTLTCMYVWLDLFTLRYDDQFAIKYISFLLFIHRWMMNLCYGIGIHQISRYCFNKNVFFISTLYICTFVFLFFHSHFLSCSFTHFYSSKQILIWFYMLKTLFLFETNGWNW